MFSSDAFARRTLQRAGVIPEDPKPKPDPIDWIQANCYLYDTGERMTLFDWQIRPLRRAFERDGQGNYRYTTVLWSWIKKSAKTSVMSAVVDYVAEHTPRAMIRLVANDLRQSNSRVGMYLRESIRHAQRRGERKGIKITPSGYKIEYPNGARVEMIPIDPNGESGGNDDLIVYSELWGWKNEAHQRMWSELTVSPNRFGRAQRWVDSYAGYADGSSPVLENLYIKGVKQGRRIWDDLEVYENEAAKMLAVWVTKPMFEWQTADYYQEQSSTLTPNEYARMHQNSWVSSEEAFCPPALWDACRGDIPPMSQYGGIVISLDAGVSHDSFGLVVLSRSQGIVAIREAIRWLPPPGGIVDFAAPEAELKRIKAQYRHISCICYDPYQLTFMAQKLQRNDENYIAHFEPINQGAERLVADKYFRDAIITRRIVHDGNEVLREHVLNANMKSTGEGDKLRLVKRNPHQLIDLAVCVSMGLSVASHWNIE